jgi:hypothetical protein
MIMLHLVRRVKRGVIGGVVKKGDLIGIDPGLSAGWIRLDSKDVIGVT